jgi:imidazolonepropionase-like amidohydrolase
MKTFMRMACLLLFGKMLMAQQTWPVEGMRDKTPSIHAFTNATVVTAPGQKIENGTILIRDGIIESVGANVAIPKDAVVHNLKGYWVYPGLIDAYSDYGVKTAERAKRGFGPQPFSNKKGAYAWNQSVKPEFDVQSELDVDGNKASDLRALGFTTVHVKPGDGIFRGTGAVVNLGESSIASEILSGTASMNLSFDKGSSTQDYPSSLMGAVALIRQTFLDASWYKSAWEKYKLNPDQPEPNYNISLEALNNQMGKKLPTLFEVTSTQDIFRASAIAREFGYTFIIKGTGYEYERLDALKQAGVSLIVPVNFPLPYDVEDPDDARQVSLQDMKKWELAPANLSILAQNNIPFAISLAGLKDTKNFWSNLQKAESLGLTADQALEALTRTPARLMGVEGLVGTLEKGKLGNILIASGNIFEKNATIYETWIKGKKYEINRIPAVDARGTYDFSYYAKNYPLNIGGTIGKYSAALTFRDSSKIEVQISFDNPIITITFRSDSLGEKGTVRLKGFYAEGVLSGTGESAGGMKLDWSAKRTKEFVPTKEDNAITRDSSVRAAITYPNMAYGWKEQPAQNTVLVKSATVWTNTEKGILKNSDVLIEKGKIKELGNNLAVPSGATVIDGNGKHVTAGVIDEHSHIAISRGGNEGSQAVSAEVRIGDVLDAEDIDIYRQLAGGVTASHILHGSANPIGGQTQIIKLRWGLLGEQLKIENAPPFIKFALGENVKQSNWGDNFVTRYPQTRLGVEQIYKDEFQTAKDYKAAWDRYAAAGGEKSKIIPPRKDLELEAILEILNGKRNITCHSYVQSEITQLMRTAEQMGFKINTFTHILEGYKVADKMKKHGAAVSSFSDWWAYKYEVYDAIPYNGAIMHEQGLTVAFNSDDAEMARRLNQEAAKAVKYGGVSEEEAWKFVTLNPAIMLHINDRVGSIKAGMDADVVLWNDNPLSIYAKPLQTYVDGRLYFDSEKDKQARVEIAKEKARLIQKMIEVKKAGTPAVKPAGKGKWRYHCDTLDSDYNKTN